MAKRKLTYTLCEMEEVLGYTVQSCDQRTRTKKRYYSDLRPVPDTACEETEKDFEAYHRLRHDVSQDRILKGSLSGLEVIETSTVGEDCVTVFQDTAIGVHRFSVNIWHGTGFDLSVALNYCEASRTLAIVKSRPNVAYDTRSPLFRLPREIRNRIYDLTMAHGVWEVSDLEDFDRSTFPAAVGDPSGFYFPLSKDLPILRVSAQVRQEVLPFAYRRTTFRFDDMDDLLKLLVAVGQIGRGNIESLEFPWESRVDLEDSWNQDPNPGEGPIPMPKVHVLKCMSLLQQCKRLKFLCIRFPTEVLLNLDLSAFMADPGVHALCSIHGVERVEIQSMDHESLKNSESAELLQEILQRT
ncbi:hypothetical protein LTR37_019428 [Vermiconidia calcicola]|uniref:Uncharacterized protein n=1 Tax=Vermiconidia calcicola TaxID=1690605 RepID=A0ACC3MEI6_9PEZI|nr:hypothetical protein LTR37_019428 [Vermiconidia calcicola]